MTITHNIEAVQERIRLLQSELPKALLAALDPDYWYERLKASATATLRKAWESETDLALHELYERLTPQIVDTIVGAYYDTGMWFLMAVPHAALETTALWPDLARAAEFNQATGFTPTGRVRKGGTFGSAEDHANLDRVRQVILDWCTYEKELKFPRDYHADGTPKSPEELANRIWEVLGVQPWAKERSPLMDEKAEGLAEAIEGWLALEVERVSGDESGRAALEHRNPPTLAPEVAHEWLQKVLAGWVALVRRDLPGRIERELDKLRAKLKTPSLPGLG